MMITKVEIFLGGGGQRVNNHGFRAFSEVQVRTVARKFSTWGLYVCAGSLT